MENYKEEVRKYVGEKVKLVREEIAMNYVHQAYRLGKDDPKSKADVEAANKNIADGEAHLAWLLKFQESLA